MIGATYFSRLVHPQEWYHVFVGVAFDHRDCPLYHDRKTKRLQNNNINDIRVSFSVRETHQIAEAQQEKNAKLREAFGISEFFVEGSSLDPERHAREAEARAAAAASKVYELVRTPSPVATPSTDAVTTAAAAAASAVSGVEKKKRKRSGSASAKKKKAKKHKRERYSTT